MRIFVLIFFAVGQLIAQAPDVKADDAHLGLRVVIAQVYTGAYSGEEANHEYVELYNNSDTPVDVTNWCINYIPYTNNLNSSSAFKACLKPTSEDISLWVEPQGYITFASESEELNEAWHVAADVYFSAGISQARGYIRVIDAKGTEIDRVGWGNVDDTNYPIAPKPSDGQVLQRNWSNDADQEPFSLVSEIIIHTSNIYEEELVLDLCPNLEVDEVPVGYGIDEDGTCQPDSCLNIEGLQISVPSGYDSDEEGVCTVTPLVLNELLANAVGSDTGKEFIEIYNPTDKAIDLSLYGIKIGDSNKLYTFPAGEIIGPGEYRAFSDTVMKFTLLNSTSRVVLVSVDGLSVFGDSGWYVSPAENESWALLDDIWQYTNRPTPGAENLPPIIIEIEESGLAPCPAGKYRNPLTNRCRNIVSDASVLAACKDGQYRNPETNRCRKIQTSNLKPCKENQYRSEETNRCRNILGASTLKPCKENQYRSEETNRCRNLPGTNNVPDAAFAVKPVKDSGTVFVGWWALGGITALAIGYGVWEWRREVIGLWCRLLKRS